ncbi:O-antigen ligase family protein [Deinococcus peraridilitoris]|uniref:Lipid A core-O-antigen ligase-like enyme n=1 Tax=Deinococcus peraridilitoris (strain DSM 19664 / LMG 22246 / CIP 109416 / KR-200) TaxID=937777 RepID=L0A7U6_DEIPD|nr:O-antigen ligase family protein [Deinococcus peraridilitoris]AFZ69514.1 lipid A core-O-antigen ligase-like enyme [Deinococcus peraridilitoris DSM 19664]
MDFLVSLHAMYMQLAPLVLAAMLGLLLWRYPKIAISSIFIVFLLDAAFQGQPPAVAVATANIYPADAVSGLLLLIGTVRALRRRINFSTLLALGLVALFLVAVLRGLTDFDFQKVVNSGRPYITLLGMLLYSITLRWDDSMLQWFLRTWVRFALATLAVGLVWFVLNLAGVATYSEYQGTFRFLGAGQAFFLASAGLVTLYLLRTSPWLRFSPWVPYILLTAVVILQHRTVWFATVAALLVWLLIERQGRGRLVTGLSIAGLIVVGLLTFAFPGQLGESLENSATNTNTFQWRFDGWVQLLSPTRYTDIANYAVGQPMGAGYERMLSNGAVVLDNPHNMYVQLLVDLGGLGLAVYLALLIVAFRQMARLAGKNLLFRPLQFVLFALFVYGGAYSAPYFFGLFFGLTSYVQFTQRTSHSIQPQHTKVGGMS